MARQLIHAHGAFGIFRSAAWGIAILAFAVLTCGADQPSTRPTTKPSTNPANRAGAKPTSAPANVGTQTVAKKERPFKSLAEIIKDIPAIPNYPNDFMKDKNTAMAKAAFSGKKVLWTVALSGLRRDEDGKPHFHWGELLPRPNSVAGFDVIIDNPTPAQIDRVATFRDGDVYKLEGSIECDGVNYTPKGPAFFFMIHAKILP